MKTFVTGASGFLGSHLVRRLLADGHEVAIMLRPGGDTWRIRSEMDRVAVVKGDLAEPGAAVEGLRRFGPEVVFHLAWQGGNSYKFQHDPEQVLTNLVGTLRMTKLAADSGATRFVGLGTCVEYGSYEIPVRETQAATPQTMYGKAKHLAGLGVLSLGESLGIEVSWVRLFWAYGPCDDPLRLLPGVILSLLRGRRPAVTEGLQKWDYLHVDDCVEALVRLGAAKKAGGIFNLGSGRAVPIREVVERIRDLVNPGMEVGFGEVPYRPGQAMHLQADTTRLQAAVDWRPRIDLADGLARTVKWFRENQRLYPD